MRFYRHKTKRRKLNTGVRLTEDTFFAEMLSRKIVFNYLFRRLGA